MKIDWFDRIAKCLKKRIVANVWSDGDEILCKTESAADAIADIIESLYLDQGDDIIINTGQSIFNIFITYITNYNIPIKSTYKSQNFTYTFILILSCENNIKTEKKDRFLDLL